MKCKQGREMKEATEMAITTITTRQNSKADPRRTIP